MKKQTRLIDCAPLIARLKETTMLARISLGDTTLAEKGINVPHIHGTNAAKSYPSTKRDNRHNLK